MCSQLLRRGRSVGRTRSHSSFRRRRSDARRTVGEKPCSYDDARRGYACPRFSRSRYYFPALNAPSSRSRHRRRRVNAQRVSPEELTAAHPLRRRILLRFNSNNNNNNNNIEVLFCIKRQDGTPYPVLMRTRPGDRAPEHVVIPPPTLIRRTAAGVSTPVGVREAFRRVRNGIDFISYTFLYDNTFSCTADERFDLKFYHVYECPLIPPHPTTRLIYHRQVDRRSADVQFYHIRINLLDFSLKKKQKVLRKYELDVFLLLCCKKF